MRRLAVAVLVGTMAVGLAACAKDGPSPEDSAVRATPPPAGSPLAKVQVGMSQREVENLIGAPQDENAYVTGKAFIPWYYGGDRHRVAYYYKGMGRVIFAGGGGFSGTSTVSRVEYDPNEPGRRR
jgi:hypothetical protein